MEKLREIKRYLENAVKNKKLYPYLIDEEGNWTTRKDVRNVRVMGSGTGGMRTFNNEWMIIKGGGVGPNRYWSSYWSSATDAPVMILKSCIGNRALGWDLLPPGSESFEFTDSKGVTWIHPGYKGSLNVGLKELSLRKSIGMRECSMMATLPELRKFFLN